MDGIKFVTFTKELDGEDRDFKAVIGAALTVNATANSPSSAFSTVGDIRKLDEKRAEVKMWGSSSSPWGTDRFEVEYDTIG
jgi:hypothetical protein